MEFGSMWNKETNVQKKHHLKECQTNMEDLFTDSCGTKSPVNAA